MPTPKPGQIRCPTCHRPTPLAAFCTQCGSAIPGSAQARPRGMDRSELEARIRQRRPGEGILRRGTHVEDPGRDARHGGYVPFAPEPEDSRAVREPVTDQPEARVDNTSPDFDWSRPRYDDSGPAYAPADAEQPAYPPPDYEPGYEPPAYEPPAYEPPAYEPAAYEAGYADAADEEPYGAPEDAYPYPYPYAATEDVRGRRGSTAMPIVGFILLCVLALGVGAVLAGMLGGGPGPVADASPTPSPTVSLAPSLEPTTEPTAPPSQGGEATPEPADGPITFPDGAVIEVQPCATQGMSFDGCQVDGSVITDPTMWVWIGFDDAQGDDTFVLTLRSGGQTIDQQEKVLGDVLDCPGSCSGYLIGAAYRDLEPGEYELVVRRNDDFADSATFTVEG